MVTNNLHGRRLGKGSHEPARLPMPHECVMLRYDFAYGSHLTLRDKSYTRYLAGLASPCNAISSTRVLHACQHHPFYLRACHSCAGDSDECISLCSSVNINARPQPYSIIVPGLVGHYSKVASTNKGLSGLILTLALLAVILTHNKYNSCLVFLSLRIRAPSVSLVCGKHWQKVYYAKAYLWRGLFVRLSFTPHSNPALTMDPTAPPPPIPTTPTRRYARSKLAGTFEISSQPPGSTQRALQESLTGNIVFADEAIVDAIFQPSKVDDQIIVDILAELNADKNLKAALNSIFSSERAETKKYKSLVRYRMLNFWWRY